MSGVICSGIKNSKDGYYLIVLNDSICSSKIDDGILLAWVLDILVFKCKIRCNCPCGNTRFSFRIIFFRHRSRCLYSGTVFVIRPTLKKIINLITSSFKTTNKQPPLNRVVEIVMSGKILLLKLTPNMVSPST